MKRQRLLVLWLVFCVAYACEDTRFLPISTADSTSLVDDVQRPTEDIGTDTGRSAIDIAQEDTPSQTPDLGQPPTPTGTYSHVSPPSTPTPTSLQPDRWVTHATQDLMPFWMQAAALGSPAGNFPTFRTMTGAITSQSERRPRMIGRQVFTYCAAFLLTGDPSYLEPASVGTRWLLQNAWDPSTGGWHALLDAQGAPTGSEPRTAQDAAYAALGLSAWFFITRDPAAEARILDTRDLLLEGALWDPVAGRIRDAVSADHQTYIDIENDGGAELVAQLDAVNAFLLLSQRVLTSEQRRDQFAQDLQLLGEILVRDFFSDGMFWGVHNQQGNYAGRHVDFGHNLKAYWMLLQIDKATATQPFRELLDTHLVNQLSRAFDAVRGRWGKRPTSGSGAELGSDWWIWAECDQLAATVNLQGGTYDAWLSQTAQHWSDFLDTTRPARELIPTIDENGAWVYPWPDNDTAKANQWKNGYHGVEHALIMYLHGHWRADTAATLYFAPLADAGTVTAPPYLWHGSEVARTLGETINLSGAAHTKVTVQYERLF